MTLSKQVKDYVGELIAAERKDAEKRVKSDQRGQRDIGRARLMLVEQAERELGISPEEAHESLADPDEGAD